MSSLLVGVAEKDELRCVGEVEVGFSLATRVSLAQSLQSPAQRRSPFTSVRGKRGAVWVAPSLVAAVTFQEWMEGCLRHPCVVGLRED